MGGSYGTLNTPSGDAVSYQTLEQGGLVLAIQTARLRGRRASVRLTSEQARDLGAALIRMATEAERQLEDQKGST